MPRLSCEDWTKVADALYAIGLLLLCTSIYVVTDDALTGAKYPLIVSGITGLLATVIRWLVGYSILPLSSRRKQDATDEHLAARSEEAGTKEPNGEKEDDTRRP